MKKPLILLSLVFALFVFAACRLDSHTTFKTPKSGQLEISWSMTQNEENLVKQATQMDAKQLCNQFKEKVDEPTAKVEFRVKGKERVCIVNVPFDDVEKLKELYGSNVSVKRIGEENGKFYYDVVVSSADSGDAASLGLTVQSTWRVTMPGKVLSHNGDELKGRTVIWNLPAGGGPRHLQAVSRVGGLSTTALLGIVCIAGLVLLAFLGGVAWLVIRQNKKAKASEPPLSD